jgi:hypothetical protein
MKQAHTQYLQSFLCVSDIPSLSFSWHWATAIPISQYFHVSRSLLRKFIQSNRSLNLTYIRMYIYRVCQIVPTALKTSTWNETYFLPRLLSVPLKLIPLCLFFLILYGRVHLYVWFIKKFLSLENYMKEANQKSIYILLKQHCTSAVFSNFYITFRFIRNLWILSSVNIRHVR